MNSLASAQIRQRRRRSPFARVLLLLFLAGCATNSDENGRENGRGKAGPSAAREPARYEQGELPSEATRPLEEVAAFHGAMPTGVTVSQQGRIFVNFPRWGDPVPFTVAEIKNGQPSAYPEAESNRLETNRTAERFISVQSLVVDARDRLWVLDTGSLKMEQTLPGGPKLVGIDLSSNRVFKTISFPSNVALPTTYLNDMRFDLRHGQDGFAYITDSSDKGPNGLIVVELGSGKSWRRLHEHPSTKAEMNFLPTVEGQPLRLDKPGQPPQPLKIGSDGIAISSDGSRLFYCPLASRRLYSVSTEALRDRHLPEEQVAATVRDEGPKPASDGLESDAQGRIYMTDYEHNAIVRRLPGGEFEPVTRDARLLWPDTLALANDGYLYVIANQLHRQPQFHDGVDRRVKPYHLFRVRIDAKPVRLGPEESHLQTSTESK